MRLTIADEWFLKPAFYNAQTAYHTPFGRGFFRFHYKRIALKIWGIGLINQTGNR